MTDFQRREDALLEKISALMVERDIAIRERDEARAARDDWAMRVRILTGVEPGLVSINVQ
jgi:hypothetical protein